MGLKHAAAIAALMAACAPALAFDLADTGPTTVFYISIPLDANGLARKEREFAYGIQLQGKREYQAVNIDSKMLNFLPLGGLEAKWIIAGVVAAGAAAALGSKDSSTTASLQAQQTQHQQQIQAQQAAQQPAEPCPQVCN
jgi:hypothetical protein